MSEAIRTGKTSGVKLEVYQGIYSLSAQNENNGKFWAQWAKYKKNKTDYFEKDFPVKAILGDKETAKGVLRMLFKEIDGGATTQNPPAEKKTDPPPPPPANVDLDVPF